MNDCTYYPCYKITDSCCLFSIYTLLYDSFVLLYTFMLVSPLGWSGSWSLSEILNYFTHFEEHATEIMCIYPWSHSLFCWISMFWTLHVGLLQEAPRSILKLLERHRTKPWSEYKWIYHAILSRIIISYLPIGFWEWALSVLFIGCLDNLSNLTQ